MILTALNITFSKAESALIIVTDIGKQGSLFEVLAEEALKSKGVPITQIKYQPLKRAFHTLKTGYADLMIGVYYAPEREHSFLYSTPYTETEISYIGMANQDICYSSPEDLQSYNIGVVKGGSLSFSEVTGVQSDNFKGVIRTEQNLKKLIAGRIDLFIENKYEVSALINNQHPELKDKLVFLDPPIWTVEIYAISAKSNPDHEAIINTFNSGIQTIKQNGLHGEIVNRFESDYLETVTRRCP